MPNIIVNEKLCTKCNICGSVCVMGIIEKATDTEYPTIKEANQPMCFKCGHCESFCPQLALALDFNIEEKITAETKECQIEAKNLALYLKNRRSIRAFSNKPVSRELIQEVLEVARYAPTGGNSQTVQWLVFSNPLEVKHIASLTVDWMRSIKGTPHPLAGYVPGIIEEWDKGEDPITRNAPHLIFAHIPVSKHFYDPTDAIIALTHFDIAAPAFGLGACWAGFIKMAMESYKPLQVALALPEGRRAVYPLFFGYPTLKPKAIPRRNPLEIEWR